MRRVRDLMVVDDLVIACDSCGGIGPKPADTVAIDPVTTAHFAVRVGLVEMLCSGAKPFVLIDALCVEMEPTGAAMLNEVIAQAQAAGIDAESVSGSTEENVPTQATGIGTMVLGRLDADHKLRSGSSQPGDMVICCGLPISAPRDHVYIGHPGQISIPQITALAGSGLVHDMLPVGSRGLDWEVPQLAASAGLAYEWAEPAPIDRHDSGGPASCIIVSAPADHLTQIIECVHQLSPHELSIQPVATLGEPAQ